jgi:hypothetical protein
MKRLRILNFFEFRSNIQGQNLKNQKPVSVDVLFKAYQTVLINTMEFNFSLQLLPSDIENR